jgi:WD40 repeat protein
MLTSLGPEANRARIGNIETGEEIRTLRGHSRGIRALQFDDSKLISGSLDSMLAPRSRQRHRLLTLG